MIRRRPGSASLSPLVLALALVLLTPGLPGLPRSPSEPAEPATARSPGGLSPAVAAAVSSPNKAVPDSATPARWTPVGGVGSGPTPKGELAGTLVYDAAAAEYVYFGGCASACPTNITWTFSNDSWHNVTAGDAAPPARYYASMDYDPNAGGVLLFGGVDAAGSDLGDTWLYKASQWTEVNRTGPSPRAGAVMAFDPQPGVNATILAGGCDVTESFTGCNNQTWSWRPAVGWTLVAESTGPSPRAFAQSAYDPSSESVVVFGGFGPCPQTDCDFSDTWQFSGGNWSPLVVTGATPGARYSGALAYDPAGSDLLLYGGYNLSEDSTDQDSWVLNGSTWIELPASPTPGERGDPSLASGGYGAPPLLYGGGEDDAPSLPTDTWTFDAPLTITTGTVGVKVGVESEVDAGVPVRLNVSIAGGVPLYQVEIAWGTNLTRDGGDGPNWSVAASFPAGPSTVSVTVSDAFGENATAGFPVLAVPGPSVIIEVRTTTTDVEDPVAFLADAVSPGVGVLGYAWAFGDGNVSTGPYCNHSYASAGVFQVNLTGTDELGDTATAHLAVHVDPWPTSTIGVNGTPAIGAALAFSSHVVGGLGPFNYVWLFGDGGGSGSPNASHAYEAAGNYTVEFWANDSLGSSTHASLLVRVPGTSPGLGEGTPGGGSPAPPGIDWDWVVLAAVGAAGAVTVSLAALTRRRRPKRP